MSIFSRILSALKLRKGDKPLPLPIGEALGRVLAVDANSGKAADPRKFREVLSGNQIAYVRILASRSQLPTRRRYLDWMGKQKRRAHVGEKQVLRNARKDAALA